ncbi:hypothetical protein BJ508DRAFT_381807 [Ascobolus immersus RN42]|uniref:Uncharacterized protein n=1 Tax=Ascobolus immersus RN42 TaxID=1160509 RepID=A0A3N4HGJ2_ASCIM|nr:hypothetical protein BJ508DRAFT_381807 [Ascobolus immersus RN42]
MAKRKRTPMPTRTFTSLPYELHFLIASYLPPEHLTLLSTDSISPTTLFRPYTDHLFHQFKRTLLDPAPWSTQDGLPLWSNIMTQTLRFLRAVRLTHIAKFLDYLIVSSHHTDADTQRAVRRILFGLAEDQPQNLSEERKRLYILQLLHYRGINLDTPLPIHNKRLLETPNSPIQPRTLLHYACAHLDASLVHFLLRNGADPNSLTAPYSQVIRLNEDTGIVFPAHAWTPVNITIDAFFGQTYIGSRLVERKERTVMVKMILSMLAQAKARFGAPEGGIVPLLQPFYYIGITLNYGHTPLLRALRDASSLRKDVVECLKKILPVLLELGADPDEEGVMCVGQFAGRERREGELHELLKVECWPLWWSGSQGKKVRRKVIEILRRHGASERGVVDGKATALGVLIMDIEKGLGEGWARNIEWELRLA